MKDIRCPQCDSKNVYTRQREKKRVCQRCGNVWDIEENNNRSE